LLNLQTDYLVIGAGAVGLAFADTLITEDPDAHITIVDRHGKPGGHWNDAYSFVSLHQPSAFYGVNSLPLGSGGKEIYGANAGLYELASGAEVSAYFDTVMRRKLLPSDRVRYLPMTDHLGEGRLCSLLTGEMTQVEVRRKLVDAVYCAPTVPSTHVPQFEIGPGVRVIPPNALTHLTRPGEAPPSRFVILGAGKTAMDVCVWLLAAGVSANSITWVAPRDSWMLNRRSTQPGMEFFHDAMGGQATQMEAFAAAQSVDDLFERLEAAGLMLRIFPEVRPSMFHYATISTGEVEALRTIRDVVRMGRVRAVEQGRLVLDGGEVATPADAVYVDCTASAVAQRPMTPIFQPGHIVCQLVRAPYPTFSAALVAYVEAHYEGDEAKNAFCATVPIPDRPEDYARTMLANFRNKVTWDSDKTLRNWIRSCRLDGFGKIVDAVQPEDEEKMAVLTRIRSTAMVAAANLGRLAA
jgi:hypothetical protein